MISKNDITFIIPIFDLVDDRLNNLKFILPYILSTGCKVLLVEQTKTDESNLTNVVDKIVAKEFYSNFKHLFYIHGSNLIHKTGIINWAVKNHVDTEYVWVNDVDFYMRYGDVFLESWEANFIQPYDTAKKLTKSDSEILIAGNALNVNYSDKSAEYISLYSALSFIFNKEAFLNIGGMDESLLGVGKEDLEFSSRLKYTETKVQTLGFRGVHLWHKVDAITIDTQTTLSGKDMAIITCYFNWCGFTTPSRNFHRFLREMKKNDIPVFGVELSITDNFETTGMLGWSQLKVNKENVCFQKEACLNLVEKKVPEQYTKIAWIDCDLIFLNNNWYHRASKKLDTHKLIQLYTHGYNTDKYGRIVLEFPSIMYMRDKVPYSEWVKHSGYPGGAWAARRELWKYGGLYPYAVMGGGDTVFIYSMYDHSFEKTAYENIGIKKNAEWSIYTNWKKSVNSYVGKDISYIENKFLHEWHGDKKNRNYVDRHAILKNIDIKKQVKLNNRGIIEFYNIADSTIHGKIYNYFLERDEDGLSDTFKDMLTMKYNKIA